MHCTDMAMSVCVGGCEGVLECVAVIIFECVDLLEHMGMWVPLNMCEIVFH